ncbi:MAG: NAD(P)H-hydrate epimerase, partial [Gammaproteobacteria bacterium]|nr:NAD(P)H-hydrate epimerase [Gammaproteobacteria bacterium]
MSHVEQASAKMGISVSELMENAGKAVAEEVRRILGTVDEQHILILIGPGNNGGDGLVAARHLHDWGAKVSVCFCSQRPSDDKNLKLVQKRDITCVDATQDESLDRLDELLVSTNVVIDALFGTGKRRPLHGTFREAIERVRKAKEGNPGLRIIALDLPSGLDADRGTVDPACINADNTITLGFPKPSLFNSSGAERAGRISVVDIGIPEHLTEQTTANELMTDEWVRSVLPERPLGANKGSF